MKDNKKIIGILAHIPALYIFLFIFGLVGFLLSESSFFISEPTGSSISPVFMLLFGIHALMTFYSLGLMIYFIYLVIENKKLTDGSKVLWVLFMLFAVPVAAPIYWHLNIK